MKSVGSNFHIAGLLVMANSVRRPGRAGGKMPSVPVFPARERFQRLLSGTLAVAFFMGIAATVSIDRCVAEVPKSIIIGADLWPPFNGVPTSSQPGYMIELARFGLKRCGIDLEYKIVPWTRALQQAADGELDGVVGAGEPEAKGLEIPSEPLGMLVNSFITSSDVQWTYEGIDSLRGKKIAVLQDYSYGFDRRGGDLDAFFRQDLGKSVISVSGDAPLETAIQLLLRKRVDILIENPATFRAAVTHLGRKMEEFRLINDVTQPQPLYVALSPKLQAVKEVSKCLSVGIVDARKSGMFREILERYGVEDWQK